MDLQSRVYDIFVRERGGLNRRTPPAAVFIAPRRIGRGGRPATSAARHNGVAPPSTLQRMSPRLRRPETAPQAFSTTPEPTGSPAARYSG